MPALSLFPGLNPAHEQICCESGKADMSVPISARMEAAAVTSMPGTEHNSWLFRFWTENGLLSIGEISCGVPAAGKGILLREVVKDIKTLRNLALKQHLGASKNTVLKMSELLKRNYEKEFWVISEFIRYL